MDIVGSSVAAAIPTVGFLMGEWIGLKMSTSSWFNDLYHPPWATQKFRNVLIPVWGVANGMMGFLSYTVWDLTRTGNAIVPMTSYAFLLLLFWIHYPIYQFSQSLKCGLVTVILAMMAAVSTFVLFSQVTMLTIPYMILFKILLAHEVYYSFWLFKHNSSEREPPVSITPTAPSPSKDSKLH
uniref:Translocator protein n=1 Tax=Lygus hesperus TaxID=30085 RepID=A0A0A9XKI3_LYGHE